MQLASDVQTIARLLEKRATLNRMLATRILLAKRKRRGARPFLQVWRYVDLDVAKPRTRK